MGSGNYRPSAPFLNEVASHVKKTAFPAIIIIIIACRERDTAYATILVRCVYFITGIKKVGRDVMDRDFVLFIVLFFNYLCGIFYFAQGPDA